MKPLIDVCGISAGVWLMLLASGCSTVVNSHLQKEPMMAAYCGGRSDAALQVVDLFEHHADEFFVRICYAV